MPPKRKYNIDADIIRIADLRKKAADIKEEIDLTQDRITKAMELGSLKSYKVTDESGHTHTATYTQSTSRTIDEEKLKRKVGPSIWRRITTLSLDRKKAETLVASGDIDPVDYADCIIEKPSAPFVKVTTK
jgi:hypothetical protein